VSPAGKGAHDRPVEQLAVAEGLVVAEPAHCSPAGELLPAVAGNSVLQQEVPVLEVARIDHVLVATGVANEERARTCRS